MNNINLADLHSTVIETMYLGPHLELIECHEDIHTYFSEPKYASANYLGFKLKEIDHETNVVDQTCSLLSQNKINFSWICEDIREKKTATLIKSRGFDKSFSFWSMFHCKHDFIPTPIKNVFVEEVEIELLKKYTKDLATQLNVPPAYVQQPLRQSDYAKSQKLKAYAAFNPKGQILGFALLIEMAETCSALMRIAVVFPEFRKSGVYRELVRTRLLDAYKCGMKFVITHAYESSSNYLETLYMKKFKRFTAYTNSFAID